MTGGPPPQLCPRCNCRLLWNGQLMACISCSYTSRDAKTDQKVPAARRKKKNRESEGPSGP